jgi:hypothetical protein
MRQPKVWISLLILLIVGLHALPVLSYQGHMQTRWPFLTWAMYARSYPPGPIRVVQRSLIGATAAGEEVEVTPQVVGLSKSSFRNAYLVPLARHDSAVARELLERLNATREAPLVSVRVEELWSTLSDSGVVREERPVAFYSTDAGTEVEQ